MTEEEKQIAEKYRGHHTKFAMKTLYPIYDKYNGTNETKACFCGGRADSAARFYQWYDQEILNEQKPNGQQESN